MALNSSGSDGAKPNNSRHLWLAQISFRAQVPDPDAQIGGIDGQAHARLALAQPGLAGLKLVDESRRPEHVTTQLGGHHDDQAEVERADENGDGQLGPMDQRGLNGAEQKKEFDTAPDHQRLSALASPPGRDAGIRDKDEDQHHRRVAEQHPWIRYACEHRDGVAEKRHAPQTRDLEVVDVPPDQKRDQQVERAQARDGPRQPSPPRAEVKRHEPRGRDQHTQQRNMCPPHRREEFSGRPDSHLPQFTKREGRCGGCGHGKEQIGPGGAVAPPHQKVDHRQREARRRDHGPDDGDPTHELSFPDSMLAQLDGDEAA